MSILVIGGKGLVGMHTSRYFLREGFPVVMYDTYTGDIGDFFDGLPTPVFVEGDIKQPFHDGGFSHFAAGQDGGTLGFSLFNIVYPLKEKGQFFLSPGKQPRVTDSFF